MTLVTLIKKIKTKKEKENKTVETKSVFKTTTGRSATIEDQVDATEDKFKKNHTCFNIIVTRMIRNYGCGA